MSAPQGLRADRPTKNCPICGRPFQWRRKWKDVWEEVRYCSERCRRRRNPSASRSSASSSSDSESMP